MKADKPIPDWILQSVWREVSDRDDQNPKAHHPI